MTERSTDQAWEDDIVRGLHSLTADQVPALEITLIDAVVDWLFSPANPGSDYDEGHAGHLVSTMFTAVDTSRTFLPRREPAATEGIDVARSRIADGAHELSDAGPDGVSLLVSRALPAVLAELGNNAGERAKQAHGVVVYLLYTLALGTRSEHDPAVMDGLVAAFAGWDEVLRSGYVPPWRPHPPTDAG